MMSQRLHKHRTANNLEKSFSNQWQEKLPLILKELMHELNISEAELARQTALPQATINRILLGGTKDPRASTLKAIARFFTLSVDQLLGDKPLPANKQKGYRPDRLQAVTIPIIAWTEVPQWSKHKESITPNNHTAWLTIDHQVNSNCFCVYSLRSMEPKFLTGSLLIIDPTCDYRDGSYIITLNQQDKLPCIRRVIIQAETIYLCCIDQNLPPYRLLDSISVIGTIIESRLDLR
jgi:SOS-response transcriptional repressor LexA